jgi:Predicted periplasmic protein (DUF2092)
MVYDGKTLTMLGKNDPYKELMPLVVEAKDLGSGVIRGVECDHLAFRTEEVDWQIISGNSSGTSPGLSSFCTLWNRQAETVGRHLDRPGRSPLSLPLRHHRSTS